MIPLERRGPQPDSCCQAPTQHGGQLGFSDLGSTSALYILDEGFLGTICLNPQWPCSHSYRTRTPSLERTATSGRHTLSTPRRTQVSSLTERQDLSTWTAWRCWGRGRGRRWCCRGRRGSPAWPPSPGRQACSSFNIRLLFEFLYEYLQCQKMTPVDQQRGSQKDYRNIDVFAFGRKRKMGCSKFIQRMCQFFQPYFLTLWHCLCPGTFWLGFSWKCPAYQMIICPKP